MNILETYTAVSPFGLSEECIKLDIYDTAEWFILSDITTVGLVYTFSAWIKSDANGSLTVGESYFETNNEWVRYKATFTADDMDLNLIFSTPGTYYIYHPQLEIGTIATDWSPAPEDFDESIDTAQSTANSANNTANAANNRVTLAESSLQVLSNCISMLVTDENGSSLMTQTADGGWTFSMAETNAAMSDLQELLGSLQLETGNTRATVDALNQAVGDHGATLEYVNVTTFEDEPCIVLGESDSDFKLLVTNTRIMFVNGTNIPTYINTNGLVTQNIEVQGEIVQGGYAMLNTSDGGWGLLWKGVDS